MRFILSDRSDFHKTERLSIAVHAFASHVLMSFSVDKKQLPKKEKEQMLDDQLEPIYNSSVSIQNVT